MRRVPLILLVFAVLAGPAFGATDPVLEKTLKAKIVAKFSKLSPSMKFLKVKCVLPANGNTASCKAYFSISTVDGYYPVKATLHDSGKLSWVAAGAKCLDTATKKYVSCSG